MTRGCLGGDGIAWIFAIPWSAVSLSVVGGRLNYNSSGL